MDRRYHRYAWQDRATQWDIDQLTKHGETLATAWMAVLVRVVTRAAEKLADGKCKPATFRDVLATIGAVGNYLTPEIIGPILARNQRAPELAADECSLDRLTRTEE